MAAPGAVHGHICEELLGVTPSVHFFGTGWKCQSAFHICFDRTIKLTSFISISAVIKRQVGILPVLARIS